MSDQNNVNSKPSLSLSQPAEWCSAFQNALSPLHGSMSYQEAAQHLRNLIKTNLLELTDITNNPKRFFDAHRLVGQRATKLGPGFSIRFTVHYNLFAGTVVALGTKEQIESLCARNKVRPRLGCFALTESLAGVNSGLVVETRADFDPSKDSFIFNSSQAAGSSKNWISQGLVADEAVLVANLFVKGKNYGPQAFLVNMRDQLGTLNQGIQVKDMGVKTVGNDLDNANITFTNFIAPRISLLSRYLAVDQRGEVSQPNGNLRTMDMVGQRLFTGRCAVAQAALGFTEELFYNVAQFANKKLCWAPKGLRPTLSQVPQIEDIFIQGKKELNRLSRFLSLVEDELCECLRSDKIPSTKLQQAIAVVKVKAIEGSIQMAFALKQEVGSYALMAGTGFEQMDYLQCCKFAEGDSRILMQKMARDIFMQGKIKSSHGTTVLGKASKWITK